MDATQAAGCEAKEGRRGPGEKGRANGGGEAGPRERRERISGTGELSEVEREEKKRRREEEGDGGEGIGNAEEAEGVRGQKYRDEVSVPSPVDSQEERGGERYTKQKNTSISSRILIPDVLVARQKKEEAKQKKIDEEKKKRLEDSTKAYENWRRNAKNKPKPATQGLLR